MSEPSVSVRTVDVLTPEGGTDGTVELPPDVFDAPANMALMHQVVVAQLAAARAGTHATRTRGAVAGGGTKPYRQKGTGRARQGSVRAPQFTGGGTVHGPAPRDYHERTPKKMKAAALRGALSDRARGGRVRVVSGLLGAGSPQEPHKPSTKAARRALEGASEAMTRGAKLLVVLARSEEVSRKSLQNLPTVHTLFSDQLNTYDVLAGDEVVFTKDALDSFVSGPIRGRGAKQAAEAGEEVGR